MTDRIRWVVCRDRCAGGNPCCFRLDVSWLSEKSSSRPHKPTWGCRRIFGALALLPLQRNEGRQEGVKKGYTVSKPYSESSASRAHLRNLLIELMRERGESLAEFGATLARTIDAGRPAFSRQYVYRLKVGQDAITEEIAQAIQVLGAMLDGVNELQARAQYVRVLAIHPLPGDVIVLGRPRGCELAGCRIQFVPASPAQRYCSAECRQEAERRRREGVG